MSTEGFSSFRKRPNLSSIETGSGNRLDERNVATPTTTTAPTASAQNNGSNPATPLLHYGRGSAPATPQSAQVGNFRNSFVAPAEEDEEVDHDALQSMVDCVVSGSDQPSPSPTAADIEPPHQSPLSNKSQHVSPGFTPLAQPSTFRVSSSSEKQSPQNGSGFMLGSPAAFAMMPAAQFTGVPMIPPSGPPQVTRFLPPPPPVATMNITILKELTSQPKDGSPAKKEDDPEVIKIKDGQVKDLCSRWYSRMQTWMAGHPNAKPVAPCPPSENCRSSQQWLEKINAWYEVNFSYKMANGHSQNRRGGQSNQGGRRGRGRGRSQPSADGGFQVTEGDGRPPGRNNFFVPAETHNFFLQSFGAQTMPQPVSPQHPTTPGTPLSATAMAWVPPGKPSPSHEA